MGRCMALERPMFIGSEIYRGSSYGGWHPLRVPRVSTVIDLSRALGWLPDAQYVRSPRARPAALARFHTWEYISALQEAERQQRVSEAVRERHNIGTHSNPIFPEMFRRPATSSGGAILAGEMLRDGGIVHAPGCGTHHAFADYANGFCYFNDPVLAILSLRHHGAARIAYVDIDAHHCDGVEAAFAEDPQVLVLSVHEENRWPRTGALTDTGVGQVFNLPVPQGFHDDEMALARDKVILPAVEQFAPEAVVLQCGADGVTEDPQSRMALSNAAHAEMARALTGMAPRLLVLGGGGYNPWSVGRCWTRVWGVLNGHKMPEALTKAAQDVLSALEWDRMGRKVAPERHWLNTLCDMPRGGQLREVVRERVRVLSGRL